MARETRGGLPTSQRRVEANRRNASRSTGPRTAAGKNNVRRNALKHGLTAEKLVVVGEDAAEFQAMADAHHADIQPRNSIELELCKTFTLAAWRRQRCIETEAAMTKQYIRDSRRAHALSRQHDVLSLGERLFHDSRGLWRGNPDASIKSGAASGRRASEPGGPDMPARIVAELESTYEGCCWLLDRWYELRQRHQSVRGWHAHDMFRVIRLMGRNPLDVLDDPPGDLMDIFVCCDQIDPKDPSPFSELRCEVTEKEFPGVLERLERLKPDERRRPSALVARMALDDLVDRHMQRLEMLLKKRWAEARAEAKQRKRRLAFDPGKEADKVRRYEDIAVRRLSRVCDDLIKLRRSGTFDQIAESQPPAETNFEDAIRRPSADINPETQAPAFGDNERESEAPGQVSPFDSPSLLPRPNLKTQRGSLRLTPV